MTRLAVVPAIETSIYKFIPYRIWMYSKNDPSVWIPTEFLHCSFQFYCVCFLTDAIQNKRKRQTHKICICFISLFAFARQFSSIILHFNQLKLHDYIFASLLLCLSADDIILCYKFSVDFSTDSCQWSNWSNLWPPKEVAVSGLLDKRTISDQSNVDCRRVNKTDKHTVKQLLA